MIQSLKEKLNLSDSDIFYDDRPNGGDVLYTAKKAWLSPIAKDESHRLVVQDDIEVCDDFVKIVQQIINAHPDKVISLFPYRYQRKIIELENINTPYITANIMSGCAIIMPTKYIQECFEWIDSNCTSTEDDWCINEFCKYKKIDVITTIPSIVQHIGNVSLIGHISNIHTEYYEKNPIANWSSTEIYTVKLLTKFNFKIWKGGH